eukprot:Rhum_TRINITY_DN14163_c1_g1::Rhum_TRINITY_DN14163_c1_g1_i1::g.69341::m.69341
MEGERVWGRRGFVASPLGSHLRLNDSGEKATEMVIQLLNEGFDIDTTLLLVRQESRQNRHQLCAVQHLRSLTVRVRHSAGAAERVKSIAEATCGLPPPVVERHALQYCRRRQKRNREKCGADGENVRRAGLLRAAPVLVPAAATPPPLHLLRRRVQQLLLAVLHHRHLPEHLRGQQRHGVPAAPHLAQHVRRTDAPVPPRHRLQSLQQLQRHRQDLLLRHAAALRRAEPPRQRLQAAQLVVLHQARRAAARRVHRLRRDDVAARRARCGRRSRAHGRTGTRDRAGRGEHLHDLFLTARHLRPVRPQRRREVHGRRLDAALVGVEPARRVRALHNLLRPVRDAAAERRKAELLHAARRRRRRRRRRQLLLLLLLLLRGGGRSRRLPQVHRLPPQHHDAGWQGRRLGLFDDHRLLLLLLLLRLLRRRRRRRRGR